ncbi:MAG: glycosyltransferase [Clostridiales Family XIII bacterium]|nr:glycosyltransferase [Clostridiales Family XIII bacterium]
MNTISVIVPIYNGKDRLEPFFDSILNQTHRELEIICVNDGSTDGSEEILEKYSRKDPRVRFLSQKNAGAGVARNTGLAEATGEYCSFLDCDDEFEPDMYERLLSRIVSANADICICDANAVNILTGRERTKKRFIDWSRMPAKDVFSYRDVPDRIFNIFSPVPWNKLYRMDFIRDNNLQFQDTKNTNDVFFTYSSLVKAERVAVIENILIHKMIITGSVSLSAEKKWGDSIKAYSKLREELVATGRYEAVERSFVNKVMDTVAWNMRLLSGSGFAELYDMLKNGGLEALGVREREDDGYYYKSQINERIHMILHESPEYYRLLELERCALRGARIAGGRLHLTVDCPVVPGGSWSGVAVEYDQIWSDKIEHTPIVYTFPAETRTSGSVAVVKASVPLRDLDLKETSWKVACVLEKDGERRLIYVRYEVSVAGLIKLFFKRNYLYKDGMIVYFWSNKRSLQLVVRKKEKYDGIGFRLKELVAVGLSLLTRKAMARRKIMLIHEKKCSRAADNGFAFFKYCMENGVAETSGREIYYIIDKRSPHYERVKQWDRNVIDYLSVKHMLYGVVCSVMASSESKTHDYIRYVSASIVKPLIQKTNHVYLKHGVFAIKRVAPAPFWKQKSVLMTAVSEKEATIIRRYMRYERSRIAVTGGARVDYLTDTSEGRKEILLMPTIRIQLFYSGEADFKASEYYRVYSSLLKSERLISLLKKYGYTLNFYLHPSFSQFEGLFRSDDAAVKIMREDDVPVNELLMRCGMLITDYSSVTWDVLYMNKPILFFQYDLDLFLETSGSYMDMGEDLPGERCDTEEELFGLIETYAANGLRIPDRYAKMRESFFAYNDRDNCKRIAEEIDRRGL